VPTTWTAQSPTRRAPTKGGHSQAAAERENGHQQQQTQERRLLGEEWDSELELELEAPRNMEKGGPNQPANWSSGQMGLDRAEVQPGPAGSLAVAGLSEEENLGAYQLEGSYGRLASRILATRHHLQQQQQEAKASQSGPPNGRPAAKSAATAARPKRRHSSAAAASPTRTRPPDPSAIYRDQVYHFDGRSTVVLVPRVALLGAAQLALKTSKQLKRQAASYHHHLLPNVFGHKHTLSFWMRHAPLGQANSRPEEQGALDEGKLVDETAGSSREHLVCASEVRPLTGPLVSRQRRPPAELERAASEQPRGHHYALFLRDCRLFLQLSAPPTTSNNSLDKEWRWRPAGGQLCDNKWHLYSVNVNLEQERAELFVDGQQSEDGQSKPLAKRPRGQLAREGAENELPAELQAAKWPATSNKTGPLTLALGACWAPPAQPSGFFRGALSGLSVLMGANEDGQTLECLGRCTESLVSMEPQKDDGVSSSRRGQSRGRAQGGPKADKNERESAAIDHSLVAYQESQSTIRLFGHDLLDLEEAFTQIAYVNRRQIPSIGRRTISVHTIVQCLNHSSSSSSAASNHRGHSFESIQVQPIQVEIDVQPSAQLPLISIFGSWRNLAREYGAFQKGVQLFASIRLQVKKIKLPVETKSSSSGQLLVDRQQPNLGPEKSPLDEDELLDYVEDVGFGQGEKASQSSGSQAMGPHSQSPGSGPSSPDSISIEPVDNLASLRHRIEACTVFVDGLPLNQSHERLLLPADQLDRLALYWRSSAEGAIIYGLDSVENYQSLVRRIAYQNDRPQMHNERSFKLQCSDMSGRLLSNEYKQTVTMIHLRPNSADGQEMLVANEDLPFGQIQADAHQSPIETGYSSLRESDSQLVEWEAKAYDPETGYKLESGHTNLNRIAIAFLVFVVSLILIMLIVALTTLRETACEDAKSLRAEQRSKRIALATGHSGSRHSRLVGHSHSEMDSDLVPLDEDDLEFEAESEEEEFGFEDRVRRRNSGSGQQSDFYDEELNSDDELEEKDWSARIVMNPVLHGQTQASAWGSRRGSSRKDENDKQETLVVAEFEPHNLSVNCRPLYLDKLLRWRDKFRLRDSKQRPARNMRNDDDLSPMGHNYASSPCETLSSGSSDTDSCGEMDDGEEGPMGANDDLLCRYHHSCHGGHEHDHHHHRSHAGFHQPTSSRGRDLGHHWSSNDNNFPQADDDSEHAGQHYELFHLHHVHHTCLRQQPNETGGDKSPDRDECSHTGPQAKDGAEIVRGPVRRKTRRTISK